MFKHPPSILTFLIETQKWSKLTGMVVFMILKLSLSICESGFDILCCTIFVNSDNENNLYIVKPSNGSFR